MEIINSLRKLGLTDKQSAVYFAGLSTGTTVASQIAKKANIKRGTIYGILNELKLLGLCHGESRNKKRKVFTMSDPNELLALQNERENVLSHLLPILRTFVTNSDIPKFSIYEGIDEVRKIYYDTIKNNTKNFIYSIASIDSLVDGFGLEWANEYLKNRVKKKIPTKLIANNYKLFNHYSKLDAQQFRETKIIPSKFGLDIDIEIYSNKVMFISFNPQPVAVLIENEKIHRSLKNLFEYIWQTI